jgi:hypothetical protein
MRYWISSCGRIELKIDHSQAARGYHSGACDSDISALMKLPEISSQLLALSPKLVADALQEYGGWEPVQLANHADNLERLLWIACGDLVDNQFLDIEEKMQTLSEAIAGRGLVESKEIKRVMSERRRAWNSTKNRKFPRYTPALSTADYVAAYCRANNLSYPFAFSTT